MWCDQFIHVEATDTFHGAVAVAWPLADWKSGGASGCALLYAGLQFAHFKLQPHSNTFPSALNFAFPISLFISAAKLLAVFTAKHLVECQRKHIPFICRLSCGASFSQWMLSPPAPPL